MRSKLCLAKMISRSQSPAGLLWHVYTLWRKGISSPRAQYILRGAIVGGVSWAGVFESAMIVRLYRKEESSVVEEVSGLRIVRSD
jgi:hypothetical protein